MARSPKAAQRARGYAVRTAGGLIVSGNPGAPSVGSNASFSPSIAGGTAPFTLSLFSGALPPGRALSGASEVGTYTTAGSYSYVLRVTDSSATPKTANLAVNAVVAAAGSTGGTLDFSDAANSGLTTLI